MFPWCLFEEVKCSVPCFELTDYICKSVRGRNVRTAYDSQCSEIFNSHPSVICWFPFDGSCAPRGALFELAVSFFGRDLGSTGRATFEFIRPTLCCFFFPSFVICHLVDHGSLKSVSTACGWKLFGVN